MFIDGRQIAATILEQIHTDVSTLPFQPVFCDVLVGDDPVSASFVRLKARTAEQVGIKFRAAAFGAATATAELTEEIRRIGREPHLCGLIVQLPLPQHLPRQEILDAIDPAIDVDCLGGANVQSFYSGRGRLVPPTAAAVLKVLDSLKIDLQSKNILVLGQGELVGRPTTFLLQQRGLRVITADEQTSNTAQLLKAADVVISGVGKPGLLTGQAIKPGAVIIDAGTSELGGGIVGDVDMPSAAQVASVISPVPGGVGPVTVAMLLKNIVEVAKSKVTNKT